MNIRYCLLSRWVQTLWSFTPVNINIITIMSRNSYDYNQMNKLICIRSTLRYTSLDILTLQEVAIHVLTTSNVEQKAFDTIYYVYSWQNGIINQITHTNLTVTCPNEPSRPVSNDQMKPLTLLNPEDEILEIKKLKSMYKKNTIECTIHAIANAESYAVDLFWDLIARYTTTNADKVSIQ